MIIAGRSRVLMTTWRLIVDYQFGRWALTGRLESDYGVGNTRIRGTRVLKEWLQVGAGWLHGPWLGQWRHGADHKTGYFRISFLFNYLMHCHCAILCYGCKLIVHSLKKVGELKHLCLVGQLNSLHSRMYFLVGIIKDMQKYHSHLYICMRSVQSTSSCPPHPIFEWASAATLVPTKPWRILLVST